jgi:hypothetical protein
MNVGIDRDTADGDIIEVAEDGGGEDGGGGGMDDCDKWDGGKNWFAGGEKISPLHTFDDDKNGYGDETFGVIPICDSF